MRTTLFLIFIGIMIAFSACRSDFNFESSTGNLGFSRDTVYLDTVFTDIGSSTYTLKVYNKSDNNISIPKVQLAKGAASKYRMTVDGMTGLDGDNSGIGDGKIFDNVELLAKDSLFIFIETTANIADANPTDFLYTDQIQFGSGSNLQKVELVTLIQDAYFIFPKRNEGIYEGVDFGFDENENVTQVRGRNLEAEHPDNGNEFEWNDDKPYVVYGYAAVPTDKTLNINAGARVHFHAESGMIVQDGATLNINGLKSDTEALEKEVIFEGDRLEPFYADVPGQWGFVYLRQGSSATIDHLTLKNASVGLYVLNNTGTIKIKNTQIYDCSNVGIFAIAANITGFNVAINTAGQATFAGTVGGNYDFTHCTFNNNWASSSQVAVLLNDYLEENDVEVASNTLNANFKNCIIYGSTSVSLLFDNSRSDFNTIFDHCLIKFSDNGTTLAGNELYNFIRDEQNGNIKNQNPKFFDIQNNNLNIDETSAAKGKGKFSFSDGTLDLNGFPRIIEPSDIGAYNFSVIPED